MYMYMYIQSFRIIIRAETPHLKRRLHRDSIDTVILVAMKVRHHLAVTSGSNFKRSVNLI